MAINNIWVFAQSAGDVVTTGTLELLTKARSLTSKVTAFVVGDASAISASLGEQNSDDEKCRRVVRKKIIKEEIAMSSLSHSFVAK